MLVKQGATSSADVFHGRNGKTGRQIKTCPGDFIHQLQQSPDFQWRKGKQQEKCCHELSPAEERHTHPCHSGSTQLYDGGNEIYSPK